MVCRLRAAVDRARRSCRVTWSSARVKILRWFHCSVRVAALRAALILPRLTRLPSRPDSNGLWADFGSHFCCYRFWAYWLGHLPSVRKPNPKSITSQMGTARASCMLHSASSSAGRTRPPKNVFFPMFAIWLQSYRNAQPGQPSRILRRRHTTSSISTRRRRKPCSIKR